MVNKDRDKRGGHQRISVIVISRWDTRAIVAVFGCTSKPTFVSLFNSSVLSFFITESMVIAFSSLLALVLVLFGSINREPTWFIATPGVEIGPEIDNGLLLLDFI